MVSSQTLPIDTVKHILSYINCIVARNGNIIFVNKLDKKKYQNAILLLMKKKLPVITNKNEPVIKSFVRFSNDLSITVYMSHRNYIKNPFREEHHFIWHVFQDKEYDHNVDIK